MSFDLKIYDKYNWNSGQSFDSFGKDISDDFMGKFHKQGVAREYEVFGNLPLKFTWKGNPYGDNVTTAVRIQKNGLK